MKTICAWCQPTPAGETVSHGICPECEAKHFPELAATVERSKDDTLLGAVRRLIAQDRGHTDPDCLPGIEVGKPRRSLFFQRRNRFKPGRLGNMLLRTGALRKVA